jgi:hypothetical protein
MVAPLALHLLALPVQVACPLLELALLGFEFRSLAVQAMQIGTVLRLLLSESEALIGEVAFAGQGVLLAQFQLAALVVEQLAFRGEFLDARLDRRLLGVALAFALLELSAFEIELPLAFLDELARFLDGLLQGGKAVAAFAVTFVLVLALLGKFLTDCLDFSAFVVELPDADLEFGDLTGENLTFLIGSAGANFEVGLARGQVAL